ncbi:amidohydrolase family protein [Paracandidimonas lactea]|uniref:amidohydrolase family protein n=1 Tax=Paracandidimonas lactea TaxID=2895524 RepID=UPI001F3D959A|nr:amidohydrolase family protein [Paracandidimonas lactea]
MYIVDFRCRPPTPEFNAYFRKDFVSSLQARSGAKPSPAFMADSVDLFIKEMDEAGISVGVAMGRNSPAVNMGTLHFPAGVLSNHHICELQSTYKDRIVGFAGIDVSNVLHNAIDEIDEFVGRRGLKGIFIEPCRALPGHPDDERLDKIYAKCIELDCPVAIMSGPLAGADVSYADPTPIDRVATKFPNLKIIIVHGAWPEVMKTVAIAMKHPNVYVSPDSMQFRPGTAPYIEAANSFMKDQYLFGTAYPLRNLKATVEDFAQLPFRPESLARAFGQNAKRLLNI